MFMQYCHKCDKVIDIDIKPNHFKEHEDLVKGIIGLEGLVLSEILPVAYHWLLTQGIKYETGADYSNKELAQVIN